MTIRDLLAVIGSAILRALVAYFAISLLLGGDGLAVVYGALVGVQSGLFSAVRHAIWHLSITGTEAL